MDLEYYYCNHFLGILKASGNSLTSMINCNGCFSPTGASSSCGCRDSISNAFLASRGTAGTSDANQQESAVYACNSVHGALSWWCFGGSMAPSPYDTAASCLDTWSEAFYWWKFKGTKLYGEKKFKSFCRIP